MARSAFLGVFRLAMGVAVGFFIADLFDLTGAARAIVIIQSAMPVAVSSYLFAEKFNRQPAEVAGMVVVSTAVSFVTLPFLLLLVL
jgi:predicted permease